MIEIRYDEARQVDEVVGKGCDVHLERLDNGLWCLILITPDTRAHFNIVKKGRMVNTIIYEVDMGAVERRGCEST